MATDDPTDPGPRFDRVLAAGLAASQQGQREAALALFARAGQLRPSSGLPHFLAASEHASAGRFDAAERGFAQAVLLSPDFPLARYQLGLLQFSSQRAALALLTWQPLLSLPEGDALLHFVRGFVALAQEDLEECLGHFRTGLACPAANPAVCADVQQLIDAVDRLQAGRAPDAEGPPRHVLLSAYARALH